MFIMKASNKHANG